MLRPSSVTLFCLAAFVLLAGAAALVYPGGSWTDPDARHFSLLRNFWCDLLRSQAIGGADNGAAKWLGSAAFAALGLGLWPYWVVAASVLPRARRRAVIVLGWLSAASLAAMVLLPSDEFPLLHGVVALGGGMLGIGCACACIAVQLPGEARSSARRVSGVLALGLAVLNAVLYVHVMSTDGEETLWHPLVQKLATAALLAWMASTALVVRRGGGARRC